ncbi:LytTR family DNA-binding domain-containing protein [Gymnodinialimonas sp. 2305UL16-5]|uniref:LytTR family DNA-binding domain-containing protein n=1 Tax=Gymnodinialimonas mytili TaxID=3126503 RepID=UPI0030A1662F
MENIANDGLVATTTAEARALARRAQVWAGLLGAGFVIGLTGPFGTYDTLPLGARVMYWICVATTTFWLGYLVSFAIATAAEIRGFSAHLSLGLGALIASLPVTAWLAALHMALFATPFWTDAVVLLPYVMAICLGAAALSEVLDTRDMAPVVAEDTPRTPSPWLDQLPAHLGTDLILLEAQDHYVRAETALGDALIRTTLQEATRDLGDHGLRLHRSWWVARSAVKTCRYRNGSPVVVLHNGSELPIGRTYRRSVQQALSKTSG